VPDNAEVARGADILVLAVKPQVVERALAPVRGAVAQGALVLSIIAGVRSAPCAG
jgi:pyrroline-5-carboxylate reductase